MCNCGNRDELAFSHAPPFLKCWFIDADLHLEGTFEVLFKSMIN